MSITLPPTAIVPLISPLLVKPVGLLNKPTVSPRSVVASFNWNADYGASSTNPNINVLVNCQGAPGSAQQPIDAIRSVKIDNLGNPCPVYVFFLDSTDTIVAPPNTVVWEPVVTNSLIANVILEGATNAVGSSKVYFCNVLVPPFADAEIAQAVALYRASANITQGQNITNTNFATPGVCDTTSPEILIADLSTSTQTVINFAKNTGFALVNVMQADVAFQTTVTGRLGYVQLRSAENLQIIWAWQVLSTQGADNWQAIFWPVVTGTNLKLDLTQQYIFTNGALGDITSGSAVLTMGVTYTPV